MFKTFSLLVFCVASLSAFAFGNQDVVQLLAAGMDEKTVSDAIVNASPATFDTSATGLIALKNAGASPTVIQKVIARQGASNAPVRAARSGDACQIEAVGMEYQAPMRVDGKIIGLPPGKFDISNDINLGSGILTALTFGIASTTGTASLVLPGNRSTNRVGDKMPEFIDLLFMPNHAPEDQFVLLRLTAKDASRTVQVAKASLGLIGSEQKIDYGKNQVAVILEKVEEACTWNSVHYLHFHMKPAAPLAPGEYGLLVGNKFFDFGVD